MPVAAASRFPVALEEEETARERWQKWEDEHGGGGGKRGHLPAIRGAGGKLTLPDGSDLPKHAANLKLPPAWKDVTVARNPKADLVAQGTDAAGRRQSVYSETHTARQTQSKFKRTKDLVAKMDSIREENLGRLESGDAKTRENAAVMALIQETGLRPGSERDTKAQKQAYGATTLRGGHVVKDGEGARLRFVGEKGVDLDIPIADKVVAAMVLNRARKAGKDGKIFDTTDGDLRDYAKTLGGGTFKPKDFRTARGTSLAREAVGAMAPPKTEKEYKARMREVAVRVSKALGNTPTVALQSYIDPSVFSKWRPNG